MTNQQKIELLEAYLIKCQRWIEDYDHICVRDLCLPDSPPYQSSEEEETLARIADSYGFEGNIFRFLRKSDKDLSVHSLKRLKKKIETIPKIIAEIEKPVDKSVIPQVAELLTVPQVATMLGWGEGVVRQRDKEGLLPMSYRFGGTIQWSKNELESWIIAGCPNRQQWELQKQRKAV